MIFSLKICLAVFMLIDMLLAWQYANDRNICNGIYNNWYEGSVIFHAILKTNYWRKRRERIKCQRSYHTSEQ